MKKPLATEQLKRQSGHPLTWCAESDSKTEIRRRQDNLATIDKIVLF